MCEPTIIPGSLVRLCASSLFAKGSTMPALGTVPDGMPLFDWQVALVIASSDVCGGWALLTWLDDMTSQLCWMPFVMLKDV